MPKIRQSGDMLTSSKVPDKFSKRNAPRIPNSTVPCADCGAEVGQNCTSLTTGKRVGSSHKVRRVHAARKLLAKREAAKKLGIEL